MGGSKARHINYVSYHLRTDSILPTGEAESLESVDLPSRRCTNCSRRLSVQFEATGIGVVPGRPLISVDTDSCSGATGKPVYHRIQPLHGTVCNLIPGPSGRYTTGLVPMGSDLSIFSEQLSTAGPSQFQANQGEIALVAPNRLVGIWFPLMPELQRMPVKHAEPSLVSQVQTKTVFASFWKTR